MSRSTKNLPKRQKEKPAAAPAKTKPASNRDKAAKPKQLSKARPNPISPRAKVVLLSLSCLVAISIAIYEWTGPLRMRRALRSEPLSELMAASQRDPTDSLAFYYLGVRWLQLGQPTLAGNAFRHAAGLDNDDERSWVGLAEADLEAGNQQEALASAALFTRRHPKSSSGHLILAQIYDSIGNTQAASSEVMAATTSDPHNAAAWRMAGQEAQRLGNESQAQTDYQNALIQNPSDWRSAVALGERLAAQGRLPEAETMMRRASSQAPSEALPLLILGKILLSEANTPSGIDQARGVLQQSAEIQPNNADVQLQMGNAEMRLGHLVSAREDILKSLQYAPTDVAAMTALVAVDQRLSNSPQLNKDISRQKQLNGYLQELQARTSAIASQPSNAPALLDLARFCAKNNDYLRANQLYQSLLHQSLPRQGAEPPDVLREAQDARTRASADLALPAMSPDSLVPEADQAPASVLLRDAASLFNQGQVEQAQAAYFNILLYNARQAAAYQGLAKVMNAKGLSGQARYYDEKAVQFNPKLWQAQFELAGMDNSAGLYKEASGHYQDGLAVAPDHADVWHSLGATFAHNDAWYQEAEDAFQHAANLEPKNALYLADLASLQALRYENDKAESNFREALAAAPNDSHVQIELASFLIVNRRTPEGLLEADRLLQKAATSQPGSRTVSYWQGRAALERGDYNAAIPALLDAAQHSRRNEAADAWYALSRAYRLAGKADPAEQALANSDRMRKLDVYMSSVTDQVADNPQDISLGLRLADLYAKDGELPASIIQYNEVLHYSPANPAAKKGLAEVLSYLKTHPEAPPTDQ